MNDKKTLVLTEHEARELYPTASNEFKILLHSTFGQAFFSKKITDRVTDFVTACYEIGADPYHPKFMFGPSDNSDALDEVALRRIKVVAKALNPLCWVPDYSDGSQRKWFPYYTWSNERSGFRFYGSDFYYAYAFLAGGSRVVFASQELSDHAGRILEPEFNQFLK